MARYIIWWAFALPGVNCLTLYHGTSISICKLIQNEGFRPSLAQGRTWYGEGTYFSPDPNYAWWYARQAASRTSSSICLISFEMDDESISKPTHPSEDLKHYDAAVDFVTTESGREYIFKQRGLEKLEGKSIKFIEEKNTGDVIVSDGKLKASRSVEYDFAGRAHVREWGSALSEAENAMVRSTAENFLSLTSVLKERGFYAAHALIGMVKEVLIRCEALDGACLADAVDGAVEQVAGATCGTLGSAYGGYAGTYGVAVGTGYVLWATGVSCPICVPAMATIIGIHGSLKGYEAGDYVCGNAALWISQQTLRPLVAYLRNLLGYEGELTAQEELGIPRRNQPSCKELGTTYRKAMKGLHPDHCSSSECAVKSVRVGLAYTKLKETCHSPADVDEPDEAQA